MPRGLGLLFLLFLFFPLTLRSQVVQDIPGWNILPDSLMQLWHLDKDQVRRIKVIEEDYSTERNEIWGTPQMEEEEKIQLLGKLGIARMEEIKGVLGAIHYASWQQVLRSLVP